MCKPEYVLENETKFSEILRYKRIPQSWLEGQTRRKKNLSSGGFCRVKIKESKKTNKYLDFVKELKKLGNIKVTYFNYLAR